MVLTYWGYVVPPNNWQDFLDIWNTHHTLQVNAQPDPELPEAVYEKKRETIYRLAMLAYGIDPLPLSYPLEWRWRFKSNRKYTIQFPVNETNPQIWLFGPPPVEDLTPFIPFQQKIWIVPAPISDE